MIDHRNGSTILDIARCDRVIDTKCLAPKMNTRTLQSEMTLARPVAPEDLLPGDFVAVLNDIVEYPSFLWQCDTQVTHLEEPVRIRWQSLDNGRPLWVRELCLPFIFVKAPLGTHQSLDVRQCELVRLDRCYAKRVWKALHGVTKKKKRKRKRKSSKKDK